MSPNAVLIVCLLLLVALAWVWDSGFRNGEMWGKKKGFDEGYIEGAKDARYTRPARRYPETIGKPVHLVEEEGDENRLR